MLTCGCCSSVFFARQALLLVICKCNCRHDVGGRCHYSDALLDNESEAETSSVCHSGSCSQENDSWDFTESLGHGSLSQ